VYNGIIKTNKRWRRKEMKKWYFISLHVAADKLQDIPDFWDIDISTSCKKNYIFVADKKSPDLTDVAFYSHKKAGVVRAKEVQEKLIQLGLGTFEIVS